MKREELRKLIADYSKPAHRPATRTTAKPRAPSVRPVKRPPTSSAPTRQIPSRQEQSNTDRPMAAHGLTSYRYKGRFGWIMIGAKNHADALNQAKRSTDNVTANNLQVWNGNAYVPATRANEPVQAPAHQAPARLRTDDMDWVTMELQLKARFNDKLGPRFEYKGLRIGQDPFIAIRADGPKGTSNHFIIYDLDTKEEVLRPHGTRADIYRWLKRAVHDRAERLERERQQKIYETEEARKREHEQQIGRENNHNDGFYILPFYSIPEINSGLEMNEDLYGSPEGDCLGPFHRDIENRSTDKWSAAEDWLAPNNLDDIDRFYWELWKKLPPEHPPFMLIEAASRSDALARRGHIWIINGLEKGPPVDPRQSGFTFA